MRMGTHLLNKATTAVDPDGGLWIHVCPFGEHPWVSADGSEKLIQVIDEEACRLMALGYPLDGPSSRMDVDHKSMDAANTTEAAGWGKFAEVRDDGLWVKAELTSHGKPLVEGRVYRFTSPCFPRSGLIDLGGGKVRVTKLGVIALTNDPNLRGQKPLTNSRVTAETKTKKQDTMDYKTMLLSLLGLAADASDDAITAAIATAKEAKPDDDAMNARLTELETLLVNRDFSDHGVTDEKQKALLAPMLTNKTNRPAALALLGRMKQNEQARQTLHNRKGAAVPATIEGLSGDDEAKAAEKRNAVLHNRAITYSHQNKVSYEQALAAVRTLPE